MGEHISWRQLISGASSQLGSYENSRQQARWMAERVSGYSHIELQLNMDEYVSTRSVAHYDKLVERRVLGEPLQYVLGRWGFRTLDLLVEPGVLIPRPETEVVAGFVIDYLNAQTQREASCEVLDLGTGSGAIGLSILVEVPHCQVTLTDFSEAALAVARANLIGLGRIGTGQNGSRCQVRSGSWFDALDSSQLGSFNAIVSNPPYVDNAAQLPSEVVDYEPHSALFADDFGRSDLALIIDVAPKWLIDGGLLVLEMDPGQTQWAKEAMADVGFDAIEIGLDLVGRERFVSGLLAKLPG